MGDVANSVPQGEYPSYAEAQVRELIDRYQPSVLWNDIAWPGDRAHLWALIEHYYRVVPDGVINDRWIPWSPLMGMTKFSGVRRLIESASRKQARKDGGLIPPKPPFCDYRTPEYVVFDQIQDKPWELVRGMDRSFGHNEQSQPEHFVTQDELLWQFTDVVAKGGNLLLNVGPRGVDAQIPPLQRERLSWLGEFVSAQKSALIGTRPWILAASMTSEGFEVRYTSAGSTVFALVRSLASAGPHANESSRTITLAEVQAAPGTRVELLNGDVVSWTETSRGLRLEFSDTRSPDQPFAFALHHVQARGSQD
jgi:alpha-L-fucosidase